MKTFWNFFTGTTGVVMAIILCNLCLAVFCLVAFVFSGGVLIAVSGTPTP